MKSYPAWAREIFHLAFMVVSGGEWRTAAASGFNPEKPSSFLPSFDFSLLREQAGDLIESEQAFGRGDDNAAS